MNITCYIIKSREQVFYTGITNNISKRINQHNTKKSKFTSRFNDWCIVYQEVFNDRCTAAKFERYIKNIGAKKFLIRNKQSIKLG